MVATNLPFDSSRDIFISCVKDNQAVLLSGATGSGKTLHGTQALINAGYDMLVTEPRRLAAFAAARRCSEETNTQMGDLFGYRTAHEHCDSRNTRGLFVTDGWAVNAQVYTDQFRKKPFLVIDEIHEWNIHHELLLGLAKLEMQRNPAFKLVVMSATMETEALSGYLGNAPIIDVPGRLFPIEERPASQPEERQDFYQDELGTIRRYRPVGDNEQEARHKALIKDTISLLKEGRNVLVFQPGKGEIAKTVEDLEKSGVKARILVLHGEQDAEDQALCFTHSNIPTCVIATNVAQTSITIDYIDAVVDSGLERRIEVVDGVEGLYLMPISIADRIQRMGRAGRTKPGIYIDHCPVALEDRLPYPKPEILRVRLDSVVLKLLMMGLDPETFPFFHQPPVSEIHEAKRALCVLGCIDEDDNVTELGKRVARLPVAPLYGVMIVKAEGLGVVDDVLTIAAIAESGDITAREGSCAELLRQELGGGEINSDAIVQLLLFNAVRRTRMNKDEMKKNGINSKAFFKAVAQRRLIVDSLKSEVQLGTSGNLEDVVLAIAAGMIDSLWRFSKFGRYGKVYSDGQGNFRQIQQESKLRNDTDWIVAKPWDLSVPNKRGGGTTTLNLLRMATKVSPMKLCEIAPHLVRKQVRIEARYDAERDCVQSRQRITFKGQQIFDGFVDDAEHPEASELFAKYMAQQMCSGIA